MTENPNQALQESQQKNWEKEIRVAFEKSLHSEDSVERALAEEVLKMEKLNIWCFEIAPKIAKVLSESKNSHVQNLALRLWSSIEEGHVTVLATDKRTKKIYAVEAAGLLSNKDEDDISLGITVLEPEKQYKLFAHPQRKQYISPEIDKNVPFLDEPQTEEEMHSTVLHSLSELI